MSLLPIWLDPRALALAAAAALVMGVGGYTAGRFHQYFNDREAQRVAVLEAEKEARTKEDELRAEHRTIQDVLLGQLASANARGDALADELRTRPNRLPEASRTACKGSTGAELSGPDGQFLARFATRAQLVQEQLEACLSREQANYNTVNAK